MAETNNFKIEQEEHVAWLTLNRPDKRNTMGLAFFREIGELFDGFDRNPDVRVVVIRAEGKSFRELRKSYCTAGIMASIRACITWHKKMPPHCLPKTWWKR